MFLAVRFEDSKLADENVATLPTFFDEDACDLDEEQAFGHVVSASEHRRVLHSLEQCLDIHTSVCSTIPQRGALPMIAIWHSQPGSSHANAGR